MPHEFNADRRDKIPKQKQRVTNWSEYQGKRTKLVGHYAPYETVLN